MSLDRLINLARRTGDRLIVHQPEKGEDIVIMDVGEYELLMDKRQDVRNLSDRQLLDQINRDIAIWRANDKLEDEEIFGDFSSEKEEEKDWFSAGNILGERFGEEGSESFEENNEEEDEMDEFFDLNEVDDDELYNPDIPEITEDLAKKDEPKVIPEKPAEDSGEVWEEESLGDDEPVFYEEPV